MELRFWRPLKVVHRKCTVCEIASGRAHRAERAAEEIDQKHQEALRFLVARALELEARVLELERKTGILPDE